MNRTAGLIIGGAGALAALIIMGSLARLALRTPTTTPAAAPPPVAAVAPAAPPTTPLVLDPRCAPLLAGLEDTAAARADDWYTFRRGATTGVRVLPAELFHISPATPEGAVEAVVFFDVVFPTRHVESATVVAPASGIFPGVVNLAPIVVVAMGPAMVTGETISVCGLLLRR